MAHPELAIVWSIFLKSLLVEYTLGSLSRRNHAKSLGQEWVPQAWTLLCLMLPDLLEKVSQPVTWIGLVNFVVLFIIIIVHHHQPFQMSICHDLPLHEARQISTELHLKRLWLRSSLFEWYSDWRGHGIGRREDPGRGWGEAMRLALPSFS